MRWPMWNSLPTFYLRLAKNFRKVAKAELWHTMRWWHKELLPKHFTPQGASEYRYRQRDPDYNKMKAKKYGHMNPIMLTGLLVGMVKKLFTITSTAKSATDKMKGPKHLWAFKKKLGQSSLSKEIKSVSHRDAGKMAKVLDGSMTKDFNNLREFKVIKMA